MSNHQIDTDDTVVVCPDCDTATLTSCGARYWCHTCETTVERDDATERPPVEWANQDPKHGLAAKLDDADPSEVFGE